MLNLQKVDDGVIMPYSRARDINTGVRTSDTPPKPLLSLLFDKMMKKIGQFYE